MTNFCRHQSRPDSCAPNRSNPTITFTSPRLVTQAGPFYRAFVTFKEETEMDGCALL